MSIKRRKKCAHTAVTVISTEIVWNSIIMRYLHQNRFSVSRLLLLVVYYYLTTTMNTLNYYVLME